MLLEKIEKANDIKKIDCVIQRINHPVYDESPYLEIELMTEPYWRDNSDYTSKLSEGKITQSSQRAFFTFKTGPGYSAFPTKGDVQPPFVIDISFNEIPELKDDNSNIVTKWDFYLECFADTTANVSSGSPYIGGIKFRIDAPSALASNQTLHLLIKSGGKDIGIFKEIHTTTVGVTTITSQNLLGNLKNGVFFDFPIDYYTKWQLHIEAPNAVNTDRGLNMSGNFTDYGDLSFSYNPLYIR